MLLRDDLQTYEIHVRTTLKSKKVSQNIKDQYYYFYLYSFLSIYYSKNTDEKPAVIENIPWRKIIYDGENEDILRKAMSDAEKILVNNKIIDWNPLMIAKLTGIERADKRAKKYKLKLLYPAIYQKKVSRTTFWRHSQETVNGKEVVTREEHLKKIKVSQETIDDVAKLKIKGKSSKEIAEQIGKKTRIVDYYWEKYRKK